MFGLSRQLAWYSQSATPSATGDLLYTLFNPNPVGSGTTDEFGFRVSVSGNYAIVGAPNEDSTLTSDVGRAYIYDLTTGTLLHTLTPPNPTTNGYFGNSVAINGNYATVGSYIADSGSGRAYIYNVTTGALLQTLINPNAFGTASLDNFSRESIAISDNYVLVGARAEDDAGGLNSGKAYIFSTTTGALLHTLNNPNPYGTSEGDRFGWGLSITDTYAAVGAYTEDDAGGTESGKVYVYNPSTGALLYTLNNPNPYGTTALDYFGHSVSISGDRLIVGAWGEDEVAGTASGKAYIYNVTNGTLIHTLNNPNDFGTATGDFFGWAVSISGDYAIVGASREDVSGITESGRVYIFDVATGSLVYTIQNPSPSITDCLGESISITDNYAIVGSYRSANKAYVYSIIPE